MSEAGTGSAVDVVIVGAGAAGLSLAHRLTASPGPGGRPASLVLVEPPKGSPGRSPARTWCFWGDERDEFDSLVTARWHRLRITARDGHRVCFTSPRAYQMIRSVDFLHGVGGLLARRPGVRRVEATVDQVRDVPGGAEVTGHDAAGRPVRLHARWAFDSRPPRELPPARTTLLQHFRGWFVTVRADRFEPGVADLMDFRTAQPAQGLSFAYVLPFNRREALVEYTEFSTAPLTESAYDAALEDYVHRVWRPAGHVVTAVEQGIIPMTDGRFPRSAGESVFRIGVAGGATRPSTGYAFAAIQRQSAAVAVSWHAGRTPRPPMPHAARHRLMDAVMLRALATGRAGGAAFFEDLFRRNPPERVLRFLNGTSTLRDEWAIGLGTPVPAMLRSLLELPLLPRRKATACP
ncbi:lycopene cyclase family protein [Actinacidiphila glaucinigra]|uniref:lycopene cyclase family protein n=1 Tax=Actinacidiphila glaucinigra TaxID=235986 RepID=UPI002DD8EA43|nr:lycopene cyclase family protein [Actinacidiphila glaucinigra]WSD64635.1 lycopene cyclase family protein [Actinacidiphila glaucinigra]